MKFAGQSIGITWDKGGDCRAVALAASADVLRVTGCWAGSVSDDLNVRGRAIRVALEQLGANPDHRIVIGGDLQRFGYFDLALPPLKPDELAGAIELEINRRMPTRRAVDYGFALMPTGPSVFFADSDTFRGLRAAIAEIGATDAILPAPVACRALGIEGPIHMPLPENDVLTISVNEETLSLAYSEEATCSVLESLAGHRIDWGDTPPEVRAACLQALLVAAYGTSERMPSDLRNWNGVPENSRPRRGRGLKIAAATAALFAVACLGFYGAKTWQINHAKHAWQAEQVARFDSRIREANARIQKLNALKVIHKNLDPLPHSAHSFGEQLDAIARAAPQTVWAHSLLYSNGNFSLDFVGNNDASPVSAIEKLGMFEDVSAQRQVGPKETHYRTTFRARNGGRE